ncbi:MAG TPA: lactoylglutathione lyase [Candidatus Binatia bacterium]|nr:lactoylglutathione lyase [Candidatus Binatia bacterium]
MKILHTMLRVKDLDASIDFYCTRLGMELKRRTDYPGGEFTLAFVGYVGAEHEIELTYNWDGRDYEIGTAYGHVAIGVADIHAVCDRLRQAGVTITREPGPMKHGSTVIAFVKDPTGYPVELIERV